MAPPGGDAQRIAALLQRATLRVRRGDLRGARAALEEVLTIEPGHAEAMARLAVLERYLGKPHAVARDLNLRKALRHATWPERDDAPEPSDDPSIREDILAAWRPLSVRAAAQPKAIVIASSDVEHTRNLSAGATSEAGASGSGATGAGAVPERPPGAEEPSTKPAAGVPLRRLPPSQPAVVFSGPRIRIPLRLDPRLPSSVLRPPAHPGGSGVIAPLPGLPSPLSALEGLYAADSDGPAGGATAPDDAAAPDDGRPLQHAKPPERPGPAPGLGDAALPRPLVQPQRVSLGFADAAAPLRPLVHQTLAAGARHLLWVELAPELVAGALHAPAALPALREGDVLDVIVFGFPEQLALEGPRHGRIEVSDAGNRVVAPAWRANLDAPEAADEPGARGDVVRSPDALSDVPPAARPPPRLFFAFTTPAAPGRYALRCNLYSRGTLLQSHVVRARVTKHRRGERDALTAFVDYNLSSTLGGGRLPAARRCDVSLLLNDDGRGTHSFRFVSSKEGVPESIGDGHLEGAQLASMVTYARKALRWTAWGTEEAWRGEPCRFGDQLDAERLEEALILLARRGANLWMQLSAAFSFVGPHALSLREHMRQPGRVQIALKESPDAVVPIALLYDYPFDVAKHHVKLCAAALRAITDGAALIDAPCFRGECPSYGDRGVVCPGGFWGFRHDLGLPLHLPRGEVATEIPRAPQLHAFAPISTDPAFVLRDQHLAALGALAPKWLEVLRDRDACLARLKEACQIIYFYCHGGVTDAETPFLRVGDLQSEDIFAQTLVDAGISWPAPLRPLVILNGCHTTATSPDAMFSMLTAFASHCNAAGIIGTEITNFELVAGIFGAELLRNFLGDDPARRQLGRAVRLGRLALLAKGNPLGLIYIPFALPGLQLE